MIDALGNKVEVGDRVALSHQYGMRFGVMIEEIAWHTPIAVIQLDDTGGQLTAHHESILKIGQTHDIRKVDLQEVYSTLEYLALRSARCCRMDT